MLLPRSSQYLTKHGKSIIYACRATQSVWYKSWDAWLAWGGKDACMSEIHFVHNKKHNVAEHYTLWKMKNDNKNIKTYKKRESHSRIAFMQKKKHWKIVSSSSLIKRLADWWMDGCIAVILFKRKCNYRCSYHLMHTMVVFAIIIDCFCFEFIQAMSDGRIASLENRGEWRINSKH